jgi:ribonuclease PH
MKKKNAALRPIKFQKSYLPHAEGSCLVSMGHTQVLCVASVENRLPPHAEERGIGWVHAEYSMLPRAGVQRSPRKKTTTGGACSRNFPFGGTVTPGGG